MTNCIKIKPLSSPFLANCYSRNEQVQLLQGCIVEQLAKTPATAVLQATDQNTAKENS
jgi:hypothetical protein